MDYKLVFIDDVGQQVGPDVLQLNIDPNTLFVVMPFDDSYQLSMQRVTALTEALAEHNVRALVLPFRVRFARLERVNE